MYTRKKIMSTKRRRKNTKDGKVKRRETPYGEEEIKIKNINAYGTI